MMKISENGVDLITEFEGYVGSAYIDPVGIWTIGFGSTYIFGRPVRRGDVVDEDQALAALVDDVKKFLAQVEDFIQVVIGQNQIDAVACFIYNIGPEAFKRSTLLKLMNEGDMRGAAKQFLRWNRAGNKVMAGLTRRRQAEMELFLNGIDGEVEVPQD